MSNMSCGNSKKHKTHIIAFVESPKTADEKELMKMAKKLKKEKVSLDIASFGEEDANAELFKIYRRSEWKRCQKWK